MRRPILPFLFMLCVCNAAGQCTPPAITTQPLSQDLFSSGQPVTLSVTATGTAPLTYLWAQAIAIPDMPGYFTPVTVGTNSPQFTTPPLISNASYFVNVTNTCGYVSSGLAEIRVESATPFAYEVVNSASSYVSGQNGYGIAQGSLFLVYGQNLGPATLQQASSFPIPLSLGGTSIQITMAGTTFNAPIIYSSSTQVAAILPSAVPTGDGTLVLSYGPTTAFPIPTTTVAIHVVTAAFGIFTLSSNGAGSAVISDAGNHQLTFAQPAHAGDTVVLWGTGLGPIPVDDSIAPFPGNLFKPEVFVGTQPATVQYAGRSGCCAALDQIVFQVPPNIQGCYVPFAVRINGIVGNFASVPIAPAGMACSDPVGVPPNLVTKAATSPANVAAVLLGPVPILQSAGFSFMESAAERLSALLGTKVTEQDLRNIVKAAKTHHSRALQVALKKYAPILRARHIDPATIVSDATVLNYQGAAASFGAVQGPTGFASQFVSAFPAPGTCTVGHDLFFQQNTFGIASTKKDAGPQLLLSGPSGTQTLNRLPGGSYQLPFGPGTTNFGLPPGTYSVSSTGGRDIGAFTASLQVASPLTWTNKSSIPFIDRSQPLTITWSGGSPSGYVVFGGAISGGGAQATAFMCVENAAKQTLTVPDFVLSSMPQGSSDHGSVFLTAHPLENLFTAPGIDIGYFANLSSDSEGIGFH